MSTKQETVDYILEQLSDLSNIRARKMFGEYALYCDDKVVALICDDVLFVKPTDVGRKIFGSDLEEGKPYPDAKLYFKVDDRLEDRKWLEKLIKMTADELPLPNLKKRSRLLLNTKK